MDKLRSGEVASASRQSMPFPQKYQTHILITINVVVPQKISTEHNIDDIDADGCKVLTRFDVQTLRWVVFKALMPQRKLNTELYIRHGGWLRCGREHTSR